MQLITLERSQTTKLFWGLAVGFAAVGFLTAKQDDAVVIGAAVLLGAACFFPFYFWMLGAAPGLPIWPVFTAMVAVTTVLPMLQDAEALASYSSQQVMNGALTTLFFVVAGTVAWLWVSSKAARSPSYVLMITRQNSDRVLLLFIVSVILFQVNSIVGLIPYPGNTMPVARSITNALASMGIFVLSFYMGRGLLSFRSASVFLTLMTLHVLLSCTSLMLASAIVPVALATLGYMLGSNRIPWKMMLLALVVISILHAGKSEMRKTYWAEGSQWVMADDRLKLLNLPQFFAEWAGYGLTELGGVTGVFAEKSEEDDSQSVFERAGILHMLLLVQAKTPEEVPFFDGATYAPIPRLLIPRFIDDEKGISHVANIMLSINYGVLTIEGAQTTSVGWGLISEAYANFGYLGVLLMGAGLGVFYAMVARLTVGVPMTSLRFVLGLLILAGATKTEFTLGIFVTSQFQGVVGVSLAALVLMKRQRNPFAAANGGLRDEGGKGLRDERTKGLKAEGSKGQPSPAEREEPSENEMALRQTGRCCDQHDEEPNEVRQREAKPRANQGTKGPRDQGMPAPGLLTALIEGEAGREAVEATVPALNGNQGEAKLSSRPAHKLPRRVASWMPRRMREQIMAQQEAEESERPRA